MSFFRNFDDSTEFFASVETLTWKIPSAAALDSGFCSTYERKFFRLDNRNQFDLL